MCSLTLRYASGVIAFFMSGAAAFGQSGSLSLSSSVVTPGGTVSLNLSLNSSSGSQPAGIEWTFAYSTSNIVAISASAGTAATAAGKSLSCAGSPGSYMCLLTGVSSSGLDANPIQNGVVAVLTVTLSAATSGTSISVTNALSTSSAGGAIQTTATGGTITAVFSNPATQTITFNPLGNVTFGVAPFSISATASSGLTVSFASTTTPVCTVSGSTATIVDVGTCAITATQPGNASWLAAIPVTRTFSVTSLILVLTAPANGATGITTNPTLIWNAASGATSYNVYFGTSSTPPLVTNTTSLNYTTATLGAGVTYHWQIVAMNSAVSAASAIWSFTVTPQGGANCGLDVSPTLVFLDSTSQSAPPLSVTTGPACSWVASANAAFIGITSGASGSGNGAVTFSVPANTTGADLTGTLSVNSQPVSITQRETAVTFNDVQTSNGFFDFINTMYERGITAGCAASPLQYCPNSTATRDEMAVFIITAIEGGETFSYTTTPYFTDVPATDPFFKFVQKMKDLGITSGCSATMYCPDDPVTRGEMAVFIILGRYGAINFSALPGYSATQIFSDVPPSSPFYPFIQEMAETGITGGCGSGMYCPNAALTRGQMAVFVVTGLLNQLLPATTPLIATAVPNAAAPGQTLTLALGGVNTHFVQGTTQVTMAPGITPSGIVVINDTSLTVQVAVSPGVVPGPTSIVATTGTEEAVLPNGFTVQ